jgi:hypothetical protein
MKDILKEILVYGLPLGILIVIVSYFLGLEDFSFQTIILELIGGLVGGLIYSLPIRELKSFIYKQNNIILIENEQIVK